MNNILRTTILLSLLTILLIIMGCAVGGKAGMTFAFLMAAVMIFGSYWFSGTTTIPLPDARPATTFMFNVNPLTGGGLMSLFSTHPPMEECTVRCTTRIVST
jgi:hypothetical protein